MTYFQVILNGDKGEIAGLDGALESAKQLCKELTPGESVEIEAIEMTEEEFEKLPEFGGW